MTVLAGTADGLVTVDGATGTALAGHRVDDVAHGAGGWIALVDGESVWRRQEVRDGDWQLLSALSGPQATCLVASDGGAIVGTAEAHLLRVAPGRAERVSAFDEADGRDGWYTPWGGPPETRSLAAAADGTIYANVHVGGIVRSGDGGATWRPTIDVDADVHQVLVAPGGDVLAATAYGLARSLDGGATWTFSTEGLHARYSRAVAVAGDWLLLSASTGPSTHRAAVYRRPLDAPDDAAFERCGAGLPEWFDGNVDTRCLVAAGERAALATQDGAVYVSDDAGATWRAARSGLGRVTCLAVAA
jgi:hypothetical protein